MSPPSSLQAGHPREQALLRAAPCCLSPPQPAGCHGCHQEVPGCFDISEESPSQCSQGRWGAVGGWDLGHARFGEIKSPPGRAACTAPWGAPSRLFARPCSAAVPGPATFPVTCFILAGAVDPAPPSKVGSCPLVATGHLVPPPRDTRHRAHRSVRLLVPAGPCPQDKWHVAASAARAGGKLLLEPRQRQEMAGTYVPGGEAAAWAGGRRRRGALRQRGGQRRACGGLQRFPHHRPVPGGCPGWGGQPQVPRSWWGCLGATHAVGAQGAVWGWGRRRARVPVGAG